MSVTTETTGIASDMPRVNGLRSLRCANLRTDQNAQGPAGMTKKSRQGKPGQESLSGKAVWPGRLPTFFLRTKLLPPRPTPELLSRPRLAERLLANLANPVTLVTANAGSGKTTLVADFLRTHDRPFVWYQLDRADADPFVFLGYLTFGIRQKLPQFGEAMFSYLQESAGELAQYPERAVDVLLNEVLERAEQQLILVLDDYHHLGSNTPVHAVLDRLLAYLPDVLHVIIVSREMPPLALARLRAQTSLSTIDRTDLAFTEDETRELFKRVFDVELTPKESTEYRERTHGWITALQLVKQIAHRRLLGSRDDSSTKSNLIDVLRQSERDIFDYFAEEVFLDEPKDVQDLLLRVSLLDRIELDACAALYPDVNSSRVLPDLVRRNVFLTVATDDRGEEYRLHPLFQQFLRRRLRSEVGRSGVAEEHESCADYFIQREAWEQAVRHLLTGEDFSKAAELIADKGTEWIRSGALSSLAHLADSLPVAALEARPRALSHRAEVARLCGEYDVAQSMFRRATFLCQQQRDKEGEAEALHSLATIARRQGDYSLAFQYLDRAIELTDPSSAVRMKCGNTRGLCFVALGDWSAAELEFRSALQAAEDLHDDRYARVIAHNLGTPAGLRGDFGEALRWLSRMLRREGHEAPIPQEAVAHLNIARCHIYRGDFAHAEHELDTALEYCQRFSLVGLRAESFETYGNLYRERGDVQRANEYYERAARAYDEAGINLDKTELYEEKALLNLRLGDLSAAFHQIDRLLISRDRTSRDYFTALLTRARIRVAQRDYDCAAAELQSALEYFREHTHFYYEAQACMASAACYHGLQDEPKMMEQLRRAVDLAVRYDYEFWLEREIRRNASLFSTDDALELLPADLREIANSLESEQGRIPAPATELAATAPVTDLTINMLGPVEIMRDPAKPLAADAWTTRRARDILCFIASRRHRRASKDTIIDTFWGDADLSVVEKNFHPTVSHIRKALNSNQPLKQNFLIYRDGDYQLNQDYSYRIDTEEFDRLLAAGEDARRARQFENCINAYEAAAALYRGEFIQGSYETWVEEQRAYYREQFLRVLEALAGVAQKTEDWQRSLQLAKRILHEDQFREDIHCLVMRAHAALGNRNAVRDQFELLKQLLGSELGVEPGAETKRLYHQLVN